MTSNILPLDGEALYFPELFSSEESDRFFEALQVEIAWKQEPIVIFGRSVMQPRLTAWYGDEGSSYSYSGITMQPEPWTEALSAIKERIEKVAGLQFNSALLNQYRDEKDSVGWHRDNEKELGPEPVIGSVSFGATRTFHMRRYVDKSLKTSIDLMHGSLLLMRGTTQQHWEHCIPKRSRAIGMRINITFRVVGNDAAHRLQ